MSDELTHDDDGTLATWLAGFVLTGAPAVEVTADAGAVPVQDGWWLLTAAGRRPLLAWVDGAPVTLGDKMDTPSLTKEVRDNVTGVWGESGTYGSGQSLDYRLSMTVPLSIDSYETYWVELHDTWDEHLTLDEKSVRLTLLQQDGTTVDLSASARVTVSGSSLTVRLDNLLATPAAPDDVLVLSYTMSADPLFAPGAAGLVNDAWGTFPSWDGEGETPHDRTRVYSFQVSVHKTDPSGKALAGAVFGVRNKSGEWLAADGDFGAEKDRATFTTNADGLTSEIPLLAPGDYVLVELEAPEGYLLPEDPEAPFTITAEHDFAHLDLTVEAEGAATVEEVSADGGSFVLEVVDQPQTPPGTPPDMPRTGDVLPAAGGILLLAGLVALVASRAARRTSPRASTKKTSGDSAEQ